ncbi:efflux RND transporter periplasmic adaptor subunit [Oscillatoria laete-virens NRMC-F 0139]|nr:efflux RND transporter periplasmic adaptor subunit [Oscillatoria laete-virens]MDL5054108.1 efflux RND transporter periplasmic adaptor subunit [Oscillatoria laete-virens NRMC-F 0139]
MRNLMILVVAFLVIASVAFFATISPGRTHAEDTVAKVDHKKAAKAPVKEEPRDPDEPEKSLGAFQLSEQAQKDAKIEAQFPKPRTLNLTVQLPGEVTLNGDKVSRLASKVAGNVQSVTKSVGDKVEANERLAILESAELGTIKVEYFMAKSAYELAKNDHQREQVTQENSAKMLDLLSKQPDPAQLETDLSNVRIGENKSKLLKAYSSLKLAKLAWVRAEKLKPDNLITAAEFESARRDVETQQVELRAAIEDVQLSIAQRVFQSERALRVAESNLRNAERRLFLLGLTATDVAALENEKSEDVSLYVLKSPFPGTIIERDIGAGEQQEANKSAFVVADLSSVWVQLSVFPKNATQIKAGQSVKITAQGIEKVFTGKIALVTPIVDERTRAATARVVVENPDGLLRPGMFVVAEVTLEEARVELSIPNEAVVLIDNKNVVFVKSVIPGKYEAQPITLGRRDRSFVEVKVGIYEDSEIACTNTFILKADYGKGNAVGCGCEH